LRFEEKDRKGKVNVDFIGYLELDKDNLIILNISTDEGSIKRASICFDYSMRIIDINLRDNFIPCYWVNHSYYPHNNSAYILPKGEYRCLENNYIEKCDRIENGKCFSVMEIPETLRKKASKCFKLGKDIHNDGYSVSILVKTMPFMKEEYISLFVIDEEENIFSFTKEY